MTTEDLLIRALEDALTERAKLLNDENCAYPFGYLVGMLKGLLICNPDLYGNIAHHVTYVHKLNSESRQNVTAQ